MKCYIATFYQYDNYGTRLQNFALSHAIYKLGAEPITISINNKRVICMNIIKNIFSYLPIVSDKQKIWINNRKKRKVFKKYNSNLNMRVMTYNQMYRIDFSDAVAIAGSDQIWSPEHLIRNKREEELYLLQFAPKEKKFAYAPSFGVKKIPDELQKIYKDNLKGFAQLSVRESSGQKIIEKLINQNVPVLPDPVFLLEKEEWRKEYSHSAMDTLSEKYVVIYFLGQQNECIMSEIEKNAKSNHYKVIAIAGNHYKSGDVVPSPDEFVQLIDGAQVVFTDSFHATAFSIIMQTPFLVFKRKDVEQFSRIENLLNKYDYMDCLVDDEIKWDKINNVLLNINMDVENIIRFERQKGIKYLKNILNINKT